MNDDFDDFVKFIKRNHYNSYRFPSDISNCPPILKDNPPLLSTAAYFGSLQCLNHLLENGADIKNTDTQNRTVAHFAVAGAHVFVIRILCDYGVDFNGTLHLASGMGDICVLKYLINELRLDPSTKDSFSSTLLHSAAMGGDTEIVKYLISLNRIDVNSRDNNGNTPLHLASLHGNLNIVNEFLDASGIEIMLENINGVLLKLIKPLFILLQKKGILTWYNRY